MQIYDAHHHLWDLSYCNYPWLMQNGERRFFGDPTPIQKDYLVRDLRQDAVEFELVGSTHIQVGVQAGDEVKESQWLSETQQSDGLPSAIVAFCDLSATDARTTLEAHATYESVRGIRHIVGRERQEDIKHDSHRLLTDPIWLSNFASLGEFGLSFDLQLIPQLHYRAADVLAANPDIPVAVCHAGSPWDQTPSGLKRWRHGMHALALRPNTYCKLSGLGMFTGSDDVRGWQPIIEQVIELFGPHRVMCGSNFPVDKLYLDYTRVWRAFDQFSAGLSTSDRANIFCDNARRFYRLLP